MTDSPSKFEPISNNEDLKLLEEVKIPKYATSPEKEKKKKLENTVPLPSIQRTNESILEKVEKHTDEIWMALSPFMKSEETSIKVEDSEHIARTLSRLFDYDFTGFSGYASSKLSEQETTVPLVDYIEMIKEWIAEKEDKSNINRIIEDYPILKLLEDTFNKPEVK